ncbi:MAG: enoyl-CoA hydratase/isomerase family protein [Gemmatimonadota bacterium]
MSDALVLVEDLDGVRTLTLNRPDKRNALNGALVAELKATLTAAEADSSVRVIALRGAGKDFCSGADLAELERISTMTEEENLEDARSLGALFTQMRYGAKPIVAVVHGRALAGGCGLATACDLVLARDDAAFGYPEVYLGFVPALVMTILRRRTGEGRAFELVAQGDRFSAVDGERLGLINRVFPADTFEDEATAYLASLAKKPTSALVLTKSLLYELDHLSFEEGIERGAQVNVEARMTEECQEGVRRFLRKSTS